jgi:hypothetical protein
MSKDKGKAKRKSGKSYSGIDAHKRQKKELVPPLMAVPGIRLQSWMNDRMPEMLWSALLISQLGRDRALDKFRSVGRLVQVLPDQKLPVHPTLSGLASLEPELLQRFLSAICSDEETTKALRPLLVFETLPARTAWANIVSEAPSTEDWELLKGAVLGVLDHQSQEATDCRWLRVLFHVLSGALHLQSEDQVREILEYPHFGLPQAVRPMVRSIEGSIDLLRGTPTNWPESFWNQCLRDTPCEALHTMEISASPRLTTTRRRIREVREALARHQKASLTTTKVDARHDGTFGLGAYSLAILDELLRMGNSTSILGRIGLRSLFESYVTLSYLKVQDDPNLWMASRQYGSGQAKLAFLKLDDPGRAAPASIDVDVLRQLSNEDRWLEYVSIDLGHWAAKDLRKLSDDAGVKPDYDRFYPWTSAFTHSNWAAVRNSCFDLCINPLHRLHRRLRSDTADLGDVVEDACELVDKILELIDTLYPGFTMRVTLPESKVTAGIAPTPGAYQATASVTQLGSIQREFFEIVDEFFRMATGTAAEDFAALGSFEERVSAEASKLRDHALQAYMYGHEALGAFYNRFGLLVLSAAQNLPGIKLVLGGTGKFGKSQFDSVRKMVLYADSILVTDPMLPWIESPRIEERFRNVRLLEAAFVLLHLKPLVDAELSFPPIVVVPSFEKSLEERDSTTQREIIEFIVRVLSHFLGHQFANIEELQKFAATQEAEFMQAVDDHGLFVAPGGKVGESLEEGLERYEGEISRWRSDSYQRTMREVPKGLLLLNGLMERLAPQYHLLENAEGLSSCPLLPLRAPWHYYSLISKFFAAQLRRSGNLDDQALGSFELMNQTKHYWLGNIPVTELVRLLEHRENLRFRTRLKEAVSRLHDASLTDLGRVAPDVCRLISSALQDHDAEFPSILEKYRSKYGDAVEKYVTTSVTFMPTLAPTVRDPRRSVTEKPPTDAQPESAGKHPESANSLLGMLAVSDES